MEATSLATRAAPKAITAQINNLEADQRAASITTAEYTSKLEALRQQLTQLNADPNIAPEEERSKGAGIQNQIRQIEAVEAAIHADREQTDALASLTAMNSKNADAMAQRVLAHGAVTGSITGNDQAVQLATIHASEYAAQIAKLNQDKADVSNDTSLTDQPKKTALTPLAWAMNSCNADVAPPSTVVLNSFSDNELSEDKESAAPQHRNATGTGRPAGVAAGREEAALAKQLT